MFHRTLSEMKKQLQAVVLLALAIPSAHAAESKWAHLGPDGKLIYGRTPEGDHIADFSYAGYHSGGVALPTVATVRTVNPSGAEDTAAIQAALDAVAKLPLVNGHRGAVELASGTFHCSKTLLLNASGIVLRGAGSNAKTGTTIELTGEPHMGIDVPGAFKVNALGAPTSITDKYVPSGTRVLHLADTSTIHRGDTLRITKAATPEWVHFMGMDHLTRSDRPEHWVGEDLVVYRRVIQIDNNAILLDVPLTDNIDTKFLAGVPPPVSRVEITGQFAEVGIESLRIATPPRTIAYGEDAEFDGIRMRNAVDSWMRDVHFEDTTNSVDIGAGTERVTIEAVDVLEHTAVTSSAKNFDFSVNGSQILFDRCTAQGNGAFFFATQARQQGPVVVLHCRFTGDSRIEPHQRWSTGLLVDSCDVPNGGINLVNRGTMGSGHGWTIGWSVLWNNHTGEIMVQQPPGVANWSIGDRGQHTGRPMPTSGGPKGSDLPSGIVESADKPVEPASLYLQQLNDRLGPAALTAIDYTNTDLTKLP